MRRIGFTQMTSAGFGVEKLATLNVMFSRSSHQAIWRGTFFSELDVLLDY